MIKEEDTELELLKNILSGNVAAMKDFYTIYSGYLTTVCSRYVYDKDDMKDVLQESFIKIFKAITNFEYKGPGSLRAWSTRIVVNESLKFLKTREKLELVNKPIWDLPDMTEDEEPDFDEIPTSVILEMIRSLPTGYRTVFNLYVFESKSHKEIASILKITENTSASQLHRAKNLLIKQIGLYKSIKNSGVMSNQWSDNLRKRMETHQEPSPEGLWTDIEQIIKQESSIQAQPKQRKSLLWSKRIAAAAAAILVVLFIGDYFIIDNSQEQQVITQEVQISREPENDVPTYKKDDSQSINSNNHKKTLSYTKKHIASSEIGGSIDSNNENKATDKSVQKEDTKKDDFTKALDAEKNTEQKTENKQQNSKKQNYGYSNGATIENNIPIIKEKYNSVKWTTGIYASNISSNSTKKNEGYGSLTSKMILSEEDQVPIVGDNPPSDILLQNKYREVYTDIKHRQPIIIGVSASYNIDDKWSLTSGLTYTILSSQLRSGSDNYYYTSEQTLHNVGIPLNINYNIWKTKKASVYLSAGGMVEKNVSGKLKTEYIVDNQRKSNQEDKISIDQLQWSLNAAVGVQYNFSPKVGLYAEPGTSYYFKNSSDVETIYKEKQLNLSLRFGLRFSLAE